MLRNYSRPFSWMHSSRFACPSLKKDDFALGWHFSNFLVFSSKEELSNWGKRGRRGHSVTKSEWLVLSLVWLLLLPFWMAGNRESVAQDVPSAAQSCSVASPPSSPALCLSRRCLECATENELLRWVCSGFPLGHWATSLLSCQAGPASPFLDGLSPCQRWSLPRAPPGRCSAKAKHKSSCWKTPSLITRRVLLRSAKKDPGKQGDNRRFPARLDPSFDLGLMSW